ncbi:MAG TPA: class I SAM-dependent methyltransferase, partial [Pirellulaceae bacterium]|nr:class I SAM-dependent methyltransferase [Pirellulaceae bacterium]
RLRKDLSAARAHLVVEQAELRERARDKFSAAEQMFFTRKGLEQATDEQIATYKASRFPAGAIADLCCGIGGDTISLLGNGPIAAVDVDPIACLLTEANAAECKSSFNARTENADAVTFPVGEFSTWHIDPDRRPEGRRTSRVELFQPPLVVIQSHLASNPHGAIKVAAAAELPAAWRETAELQWLGSRGECRQQVAWFGSLARHSGQRSAMIVDAPGGPRTIVGTGDDSIPLATRLGRYLFVPDNAVLAARLTGALCRELGLAAIAPGIAYLTADAFVSDGALAAFEVQDVLPFDRKQLKAWCRERHIGRLEVKKRGIDVSPESLRKAVIGTGDREATLVVTRLESRAAAIVVRRISATDS